MSDSEERNDDGEYSAASGDAMPADESSYPHRELGRNAAGGFNMAHLSEGYPTPGADNSEPCLESLPLELLMHICSYLDAKFITDCLSHVSQPFEDILSVDSYWKARILSRWPKIYPAVPVEGFDWKNACIEREETYRIWSKPEEHLEQFSYNSGIFAPVDCVHILKDQRIFASGSRDRYLNIVDVDKLEYENTASMKSANLHSSVAHKGWIWSLASLDNLLCTGSWDTYIKLWDLQAGCSLVSQFKCNSALLKLHIEPGMIMAGGYDKCLYMLDPRDGKIRKRRSHRQAVLCLAVDNSYVITGSEDKTICVFDRRADAVVKTIPMESYPMCLSYGENQLWVGDKKGLIHLFDTYRGAFEQVQTCDVGHKNRITAIQHTTGAMFTCSSDKTLKVLEPSQNPGVITTLQGEGELAGLHYKNGILVSAGDGISVGVWRPKVTKETESSEQSETNQDQSHDHDEQAEYVQSENVPQNSISI